ncbi:hypothetical protein SBA5_70108 [Candidatus Sulfotelmatomonas gaucii]|uniref:Uncharacterized protein n=1 Tax=Candidatus Sulfuritelmatomonas gaucii TaxID=2043161 RepID=A0A2N9M0S0_9BACT|nr:hypothetical protein SBA5_70108 [Candidatus Sulfotelmatomonas gaucii]
MGREAEQSLSDTEKVCASTQAFCVLHKTSKWGSSGDSAIRGRSALHSGRLQRRCAGLETRTTAGQEAGATCFAGATRQQKSFYL